MYTCVCKYDTVYRGYKTFYTKIEIVWYLFSQSQVHITIYHYNFQISNFNSKYILL